MGVPYFFKWLKSRYPLCYNLVSDDLPQVDCLYMDMNGILYKMATDDSVFLRDEVNSKAFEDIWADIINYTDSVINLVHPRKLLFIGFDGVAPRAKMNHQRIRRYRASGRTKDMQNLLSALTDQESSSQKFITNSISPGTEFTAELNRHFEFYIARKMKTDPRWKGLNVIFSGVNVPGECEHKLLEFIRENERSGFYSPDLFHCIYGADADLIMLSLSLSSENFIILREEWTPKPRRQEVFSPVKRTAKDTKFGMISLKTLREYFDLEYRPLAEKMSVEYSLARVVADFIVVCFFIGNDFLPKVYCFNIHLGYFEELIAQFKDFLCETESYLHHEGQIHWPTLARFVARLAQYESKFIAERMEEIIRENKARHNIELKESMFPDLAALYKEQDFLTRLTAELRVDSDKAKDLYYSEKMGLRRDRPEDVARLALTMQEYINGIEFVTKYYFKKCPSWAWYYPHFYAPLLSDLHLFLLNNIALGRPVSQLQLGRPFEPFKQLLTIIPKFSSRLLPESLRWALTDPASPILAGGYCPDTYALDSFGCCQEYQFIPIIPFLTDDVIDKVYTSLAYTSDAQRQRNRLTESIVFIYNRKLRTKVPATLPGFEDEVYPVEISTNIFQELNKKKTRGYLLSLHSLDIESAELRHKKNFVRLYLTLKDKSASFQQDEDVEFGCPINYRAYVLNIYDDCQTSEIRKALDDMGLVLKHPEKQESCQIQTMTKLKRNFQGHFVWNYRSFEEKEVPSRLLRRQEKEQANPLFHNSPVTFKDLRDQFYEGETAVILEGKHKGAFGMVAGVNERDGLVQVYIINPRFSGERKHYLEQLWNNKGFFPVAQVAKKTNLNPQVVLTILDNLRVELDSNDQLRNMPKFIDIGLNFISRINEQVVSNLCRISEPLMFDDVGQRFRQFHRLQLSAPAVEALLDYMRSFPEIIQALARRRGKDRFRSVYKVEDIFAEEKDRNKRIMAVYTYLLRRKESELPFTSIFSKGAGIDNIKKLLEIWSPENKHFKKHLQDRERNIANYLEGKTDQLKAVEVDPNFLITGEHSEMGLLFFREEPFYHRVGEEVICVSDRQFGKRGVVVGIDDDTFEVVFEEKDFGHSDLGGKCEKLRGGRFKLSQIYNLVTWQKFTVPRRGPKPEIKGWDGIVRHRYSPSHKQNVKDMSGLYQEYKDSLDTLHQRLEGQQKYHSKEIEHFLKSVQEGEDQSLPVPQQIGVNLDVNIESIEAEDFEAEEEADSPNRRKTNSPAYRGREMEVNQEVLKIVSQLQTQKLLEKPLDKFKTYTESQVNLLKRLKQIGDGLLEVDIFVEAVMQQSAEDTVGKSAEEVAQLRQAAKESVLQLLAQEHFRLVSQLGEEPSLRTVEGAQQLEEVDEEDRL